MSWSTNNYGLPTALSKQAQLNDGHLPINWVTLCSITSPLNTYNITEHRPALAEQTSPPIEQEANQFTGQLLIHENVTDYAIVHRKYTALQPLADLFGVSQVAMRARLIDLGIPN